MIPEFSVELGNREQGTGKKDFSMYRVLFKNQIGVLYILIAIFFDIKNLDSIVESTEK
ncbi:MAG: hypothetical protein HEQ13_01700 [Dolichospermum sp. DEX189]|nr:hypothetical protein [Dolichospermum sp. DEX189]